MAPPHRRRDRLALYLHALGEEADHRRDLGREDHRRRHGYREFLRLEAVEAIQ